MKIAKIAIIENYLFTWSCEQAFLDLILYMRCFLKKDPSFLLLYLLYSLLIVTNSYKKLG